MRKALTILLAAAFLLASYVPVAAADWDLYGSARISTFWTDYSDDWDGHDGAGNAAADTTQLRHALQGNARIGAFVNYDDFGGRFEYGASSGSANIRHLYGTANIGPGELLIGQTQTPLGIWISGQVYNTDEAMSIFTGDTGRAPMLQYTVNGFKFALVQPRKPEFTVHPVTGDDSTGAPEELLPQFQLGYSTAFEGINLTTAAAIQSYELTQVDDEMLTAWAVALGLGFTQMDPMYINVGGFYGQNVTHLGLWGDDFTSGTAEVDTVTFDDIEDTDTYGAALAIGTMVNDIRIEAGAGYRESDNSNWNEKVGMAGYYVQAAIPYGENVTITPEIGFFDYMDDEDDDSRGDEIYFGAQFRVDF